MSEEQEPTTPAFKPTEFNMGPQDMPRFTHAIQCAMGGLATAAIVEATEDPKPGEPRPEENGGSN